MKRPVLASAVVTAVSLMGGMIVGVAIGALVDRLPFHAPDQMLGLLVSLFIFGGGALWGFLLARIHNFPNRKGALLAGALGFGLAASGAAILLLPKRNIDLPM
jgi:MFS family permease